MGNTRTVLDAKVLYGVGKYRESRIVIGMELAAKKALISCRTEELARGKTKTATRRRTLRCSCGRIGLLALQREPRSQVHDYLRSQTTGPLEFGLLRSFRRSRARLGGRRFSTRRWPPEVAQGLSVGT